MYVYMYACMHVCMCVRMYLHISLHIKTIEQHTTLTSTYELDRVCLGPEGIRSALRQTTHESLKSSFPACNRACRLLFRYHVKNLILFLVCICHLDSQVMLVELLKLVKFVALVNT